MSGNFIQDMFQSAISSILRSPAINLPHIKQVFLARMVISESGSERPLIITSEAGDTIEKITDRCFVDHASPFRSRVNRPILRRSDIGSIYDELGANTELQVPVQERQVQFEAIDQAEVGETVFLVVETENFRLDPEGNPRKLKIELLNGPNSVLGAEDSAVEVTHEDTQKTELELEVGTFLSESDFTNSTEFIDFAIIRIKLSGDEDSKKQWLKDIGNIDDADTRFASIYFKADAHSLNTDIPELFYSYYGEDEDEDPVSVNFCHGVGHFFKLKHSGAPWMKAAIAEGHLFGGVEEDDESDTIVATRANAYYYPVCCRWLTMPSQWCAVFVSYIIHKASYRNTLNAGSQSFAGSRELARIDKPVFGAVAVWTNYILASYVEGLGSDDERKRIGGWRKSSRIVTFSGTKYYKLGRGHVSTVFGKREGCRADYYLMLGGNQNDRVMVREYYCGDEDRSHTNDPKYRRKFNGYFLPKDYELSMVDGLTSATDTLEPHTHLLQNHIYATFESANLAATGVEMDGAGANRD